MFKNADLLWEQIIKQGKQERIGIFSYLRNGDEFYRVFYLLYQFVKTDIRLFPFDPHHMPMGFFRELRYLSEEKWPGKEALIQKVIDGIFEENVEIFYWMLFQTLLAAEIRFAARYIPQNSHEERLTGHLLSESIFCLDLIKNAFQEFCFAKYETEVNLNFHYADVASNSNESKSGADFGVILIVDIPEYPKFIKAFRFQAKKATPSARIDIKQLEVLTEQFDQGAYYLFYCMQNPKNKREGLRSPLILNADYCKQKMDNDGKRTFTLDHKFIHSQAIPFSAFLMIEAMNPDNEVGFYCDTLEQASDYVYGYSQNLNRISQLMVVSVGGPGFPTEPSGGQNQDFGGNFLFRYPYGNFEH